MSMTLPPSDLANLPVAISDWQTWPAQLGAAQHGPQRIVCLTEEPCEWLYLLGQSHRIVGISGYTVRPPQARAEKPKVSAFLSAHIDKITALRPDCAIGFSDLQADIAAQLVKKGIQVVIYNQRSVAEIFSVLHQMAAMVGCEQQGLALIDQMKSCLLAMQESAAAAALATGRRPRVFFEEWFDPHISAIAWVSELIGIAGGDDCFAELGRQPMGKDRIIANGLDIARRNPDIIFGSWCGRKFRPAHVLARPGWESVSAVQSGMVFEIKSSEILQPGPAALTDGVAQIHRHVLAWHAAQRLKSSTQT